MSVRRIDADRELLIRGATFAIVTAFGEDEPVSTDAIATLAGTDVIVDLDAVTVSPLTDLAVEWHDEGSAA